MGADGSEKTVLLRGPDATERLGEALGKRLAAGQALGLCGNLGAGKTCLARGVARGLAIDAPEEVQSPTYLLVMEHPGAVAMVHVDAYLPEKTRRFLEDGGVDYLAETSGVVVVEWADRVADLMPPETLWLSLAPLVWEGQEVRRAHLTDRSSGAVFSWIGSLPELYS